MNDDFTALSDEALQIEADKSQAEAERCYKEAHMWRVRAGEHSERLRKISLVLMERQIEAARVTENLTNMV